MKGKITAMSMEAKASAAIIGAVPFLVVGALYVHPLNTFHYCGQRVMEK
jgi:Flp pilus assembly protein TadB